MMAIRPSTAAVAILTVAAMVLAGCENDTDSGGSAAEKAASGTGASTSAAAEGIAALPAEEILRRSRTALRQAKSYAAEGKLYGKYATVKNDLENPVRIEVVGKDYHESIQFDAYTVEVLSVRGQVYARADQDFWKSMATGVMGDKDHWIKMGSVKEAFDGGDLFRRLDIDAMFKFSGPFTKDTSGATDSEPWVSVDDASERRVYVSATDQAYPTSVNPAPGTALSFQQFGDDFTDIVRKPPASEIDTSLYDWTHSNAE